MMNSDLSKSELTKQQNVLVFLNVGRNCIQNKKRFGEMKRVNFHLLTFLLLSHPPIPKFTFYLKKRKKISISGHVTVIRYKYIIKDFGHSKLGKHYNLAICLKTISCDYKH